jgi:ABC-2 type transport system ATP-binding protein
MTNAITATDLHKNYAGEHALAGLTFAVPRGCLFGVIGADGAGKTTLMRILATLISPDKGTATVASFDVSTHPASIRSCLGYMPQRFSLYEDLSVAENMRFFADVFGVDAAGRRERVPRLLGFSRLGPFQNRRARQLSGGMKQKLALCCALIHTPSLLILDEPTTGVDPVSRGEFWAILRDLREQGLTILVSTPYMDEAEYCDRLLLLHKGKPMLDGAPRELLAAYPWRLYRVFGSQRSLYAAQRAALPDFVKLAYPAGDSLRIASTLAPHEMAAAFEELRAALPGAERFEPAAPSVEDLFFFTLSTRGEN